MLLLFEFRARETPRLLWGEFRVPRGGAGRGGVGKLSPEAARTRQAVSMCRSIKTLRPPAIPEDATEEEIRAAALQYVRKVSGFRAPAAHNREVFDRAVDAVAEATAELLDGLEVRGAAKAQV